MTSTFRLRQVFHYVNLYLFHISGVSFTISAEIIKLFDVYGNKPAQEPPSNDINAYRAYNDCMETKLDILYRIALAALAVSLAVLVISPIAAPVSDRYLLTSGIITILLMAASLALWFARRK